MADYEKKHETQSKETGEGKEGGPPDIPMADVSWVKRKYLDIPYGTESKAQALDLYLPDEGEGPFPLLVHIHGGGFMIGDKRDGHINAYLKGLKCNLAVASVEYRLSGEAIFPAAVLDCREAIRFLRVHAKEYQIDPDRIAAIGGSAGGNLSAMLGMNIPNGEFPGEKKTEYPADPFVQAAVDQFGPMNFRTMDDQARENGVSLVNHDDADSPESRYLGKAIPDAADELVDAANPAAYVSERMSPLLVQHGDRDRLVPFEQSVEFVAAVREKMEEDSIIFTRIKGADHDDRLFFTEENMALVFDFLKKHLQKRKEV